MLILRENGKTCAELYLIQTKRRLFVQLIFSVNHGTSYIRSLLRLNIITVINLSTKGIYNKFDK